LLQFKDGTPVPMSHRPDNRPEPRLRALRELKGMGILSVDSSTGEPRVFLTPNGQSVLEWLRRC
ncbi:MAG TPA: hypothetical protein VGK23_11345, partial [Methanomassiliicoccales archaeon]